MPNDEALRAAQAPICVSGGGGKGGDAPCGIDESCSAPGSLVRVWLELGGGRRAPQVGRVLKRCPRKGLRVLLADGFVWLQRSHLAEPLRTGEKASAEELAPLLRPLGAPTLAALGAVGAPPATPTATHRHPDAIRRDVSVRLPATREEAGAAEILHQMAGPATCGAARITTTTMDRTGLPCGR